MYFPLTQSPFKETFSKVTIKNLTGHKKRVYSLDWSYDGSKLASGSVDTTIKLWNIETEKNTELKGHTDSVLQVKFLHNEENLLLSCSSDKKIKMWDTRLGKSIYSEKSKSGCKNLSITQDGSLFAFSNKDDDLITFFDMRKFSQLKTLQFKDKINEFEFDKINGYCLVTTSKGSLFVYDTDNLDIEPIINIDVNKSSLNTIAIDSSNNTFATGGDNSLILLWDIQEMMCYKQIKKTDVPIRKISFSHDGKLIASIYDGANLDIFDVNTTENVYSVYCDNQYYSLAWNPKSYVLAFCGVDKNKSNADEGSINILSI